MAISTKVFHLDPLGQYPSRGILVGDPNRAKFIADSFFKRVRKLNESRGLMAYSGFYQGKKYFVQTTGMGGPSIAIVIHELLKLGVKQVIKVGTCFSISKLDLGEILLVNRVYIKDGTGLKYLARGIFGCKYIDSNMIKLVKNKFFFSAVGTTSSTDTFYNPDLKSDIRFLLKKRVIGIDMEMSSLYALSQKLSFKALGILVVSDKWLENKQQVVFCDKKDLKISIKKATKLAMEILNE